MLNIKTNTQYIAIILILCSLVSCGKEEQVIATTELTIAGEWKGTIIQEGVGEFTITVSIADPALGSLTDKVIGTGNYDEECNFNWIYKEMESDNFIMSEKIISGFDFCIDGIVELSILSSDELSYSWEDEDDQDNTASGKLIRT